MNNTLEKKIRDILAEESGFDNDVYTKKLLALLESELIKEREVLREKYESKNSN